VGSGRRGGRSKAWLRIFNPEINKKNLKMLLEYFDK